MFHKIQELRLQNRLKYTLWNENTFFKYIPFCNNQNIMIEVLHKTRKVMVSRGLLPHCGMRFQRRMSCDKINFNFLYSEHQVLAWDCNIPPTQYVWGPNYFEHELVRCTYIIVITTYEYSIQLHCRKLKIVMILSF